VDTRIDPRRHARIRAVNVPLHPWLLQTISVNTVRWSCSSNATMPP